jgi:SpoVK/Ycf46/Vps4 family AAA+-type ATPase
VESVEISCLSLQRIGEAFYSCAHLWTRHSYTKTFRCNCRAEDLDSAVLDRCDESLLFPLPDEECRYHLITRYFDYYVRRVERRLPSREKHSLFASIRNRSWKKSESNEKIVDDDVMDAAQIGQTVKETSGFSGREIGKLMIAMQGAIRSSETGRLSRLHCQEIIDAKVDEHKEKMKMKQLH